VTSSGGSTAGEPAHHLPRRRRRPQRSAQSRDPWCRVLGDASMPPTHPSHEPALRLSPGFRKVTHGCRSAWACAVGAAVRSGVTTGNRHGRAAYQALQKALAPLGSLFEPG
jgi:hypothetical protein